MPKQEKFYRDASGRLTLDLDQAFPSRDVDARAVKAVLAAQFGAAFGDRYEDPLGDVVALAFHSGGAAFELCWDHWLGLRVIALQPSSDAKLLEMAEYFDAHPPPLRTVE
jgi:hypothetical protein